MCRNTHSHTSKWFISTHRARWHVTELGHFQVISPKLAPDSITFENSLICAVDFTKLARAYFSNLNVLSSHFSQIWESTVPFSLRVWDDLCLLAYTSVKQSYSSNNHAYGSPNKFISQTHWDADVHINSSAAVRLDIYDISSVWPVSTSGKHTKKMCVNVLHSFGNIQSGHLYLYVKYDLRGDFF